MMSRGLDYDDTTLKEIFNASLDDLVPKWEMENLKILNFWDFSKYIGHRIQWGMSPLPPKSACNDHSATLPLSIQDQDHLLTPTPKRRARRRRALQYAASIDSDTFSVTLESTEIAPISPEPIKSSLLAMNNPESEPDKSSVIPQSSELVPAQLKSVPITAEATQITRRKRKARAKQAQVTSLAVREGPDLSAPNPEILDDPILVPGPVTFSEPLTSQVMPSETVFTHPVMLPEACCLSMPVTDKEVILKPASEEDVSEPANPAQVPSKMARLAAISSASVNSKPKSFSVIPELVNSNTVIQEQVVPTTVITHSMMETPDISESAKSTSVFKESTKCTPVVQQDNQGHCLPACVGRVGDRYYKGGKACSFNLSEAEKDGPYCTV
ncbi:proteoglycan 4-like protein [Labeo rohita]|uniref:Proteoglycan 4-like protein n=1 Tax=Labeo rohita TaxID=84645 RepID=A0A498MTM9_LABRO|nr:proteoglycan 4-like protein [Labeo rohita]